MVAVWKRPKAQVKDFLKAHFPSLWIQWHLSRCADTVEPEIPLLKHVISRDGVAVDVGANFGIYTRELARIANVVHAFEPSTAMADILRRTSAANVIVHEMALSDRGGKTSLRIPRSEDGLIHSLASVEPNVAHTTVPHTSIKVDLARLDSVVCDDVTFVKIDVEGHELKVLEGAVGVFKQSHPIVLIEAEERHRPDAVHSIVQFFSRHNYEGLYLKGYDVLSAETFDPALLQDESSLLPDGSRKPGRHYVNNFFFFPPSLDGRQLLLEGLRSDDAALSNHRHHAA